MYISDGIMSLYHLFFYGGGGLLSVGIVLIVAMVTIHLSWCVFVLILLLYTDCVLISFEKLARHSRPE